MAKFGKDDPERFIDGALTGRGGPPSHEKGYQHSMTSEGMHSKSIGKGQSILTPIGLDNVGEVYGTFETSMADTGGFGGGPTNLSHSLTGTSAVQTKV